MASKRGSGGKRGRPVSLTPEQKLQRERERWRRKKARKRKEVADASWQRGTNFGYFVLLWVPHYNKLAEALIGCGYLDAEDSNIAPRIDAAVDEYFACNSLDDLNHGRARRMVGDQGTVRVRMTPELAEKLMEFEYREHRGRSSWMGEKIAAYESRREIAVFPTDEINRLRARAIEHCLDREWEAAEQAEEEIGRLCAQYRMQERKETPPDGFARELLANRSALVRAAETCVARFYTGYVPNPPRHSCNCKLALPACDCWSQFRVKAEGVLPVPPKTKRPKAGKVFAKRSLYSEKMQRWWRNPSYEDDPIVRSHMWVIGEAKPKAPDENSD